MKINTTYLGDCLELMKSVDNKSIDMILCDLPYGTTACKWDTIIPFEPLWEQYKRVIKDNGAIVLFGSQPFTTDLINSNRKMFKYELIWNKKKSSNFMLANKQFMKCHENICIFYFKQPTYNPIFRTDFKGRFGKKVSSVGECYGNVKKLDIQKNGYPFSIIDIRALINFDNDFGLHPTQKPVALFEYLIKTYTNENELILDNCAGSGTTAIACINTNRNYILMEKEQKYFDIMNDRIYKHSLQERIAIKYGTD